MSDPDVDAGESTVPTDPPDDPVGRRHQRARDLAETLRSAVAANTAYLNGPTPTAAQVAAQVRLLTREVNGILRLTLADELLDTADD